MRISILRRGVAVGSIALAATAALSACSLNVSVDGADVPEGKVVVTIDGTKTTYDDGKTITGTGKSIAVATNKSNAKIVCTAAEAVDILGISGNVTLSGSCGDVTVTGTDGQIALEKAQELSIVGTSNTVDAGDVSELKVTGVGNTVTYDSSESKPEVLGGGNTVSTK